MHLPELFFSLIVLLLTIPQYAIAKTVTYNWNIGWVLAAPDGFIRPVIGINGEWPCPEIHVDVGDRLVVNVYNGLGNQSTSIHWHGINQIGTPEMDGATDTSQCPIAPGSSMTYDFTVSERVSYFGRQGHFQQKKTENVLLTDLKQVVKLIRSSTR